MIEENDEDYSKIFNLLQNLGQDLNDWIIIYTSDHGEMLGQHGIWEKQKFYEASARIPLIIRYPKEYEHRIVKKNVNSCDLFATICDLADVPLPEDLDSRSLVSLMNGEIENWNNETISHFKINSETNLMIKWDNLKYQYYGKSMPEVLFDLEADPEEKINFIDIPEYS